MSLFRRNKMNNAAVLSIPRPPVQTTVHNHGTSWPAVIAVGFGCFLLSLPLFWYSLVFLFDRIGARDPEYDAALLIISIPVLVITVWALGQFLLALLEQWKGYKLDIERELTRREEIKLLAAQTAIEPGRMNEEDYNFARVIISVMEVAYNWLEKEGRDKFPARWRPWSKTEVLATADKIGVTITQDKALSVAKWLAAEGIITAADLGQIAKSYSTLSSVRTHLDNKFGRPIRVVSPALRDNRGFEHI